MSGTVGHETASSWPHAVSRYADLDRPAHYLDFGGPAGAPTIVCVHGLGGSALNFGAFGPLLTDTHRVLVLDLYGHGRSAAGDPHADGPETVAALVRQIAQFTRAVVNEPHVLVGHSLGGVLAVLHAAEAPMLVHRLVLLDPPVPHRTRLPLDVKLMAKLALLKAPGVRGVVARQTARLSPEQVVQRQLEEATPHAAAIDPRAVAASVEETRRRADQPGALDAQLVQWHAILGTIGILMRARKWSDRLGEVPQPTLWLQGEDDLLLPAQNAEASAGDRPAWTYLSRAGVGHLPHLEDPRWTAETVATWLRGRQ